jgi:hypothetical protein
VPITCAISTIWLCNKLENRRKVWNLMLGNDSGLSWHHRTSVEIGLLYICIMFQIMLFRRKSFNSFLTWTVNCLNLTRLVLCYPFVLVYFRGVLSIPLLQVRGNVFCNKLEISSIPTFQGKSENAIQLTAHSPIARPSDLVLCPFSWCALFSFRSRGTYRLRRIILVCLEQMNKDKVACVAIVNPIVERCQMFVKQNGRSLDKLSLIQ